MLDKIKHIDWEQFHFLRVEYMWIAIPLGIVVFLGLFFYAESNSWKKYIAKDLRPFVIQKGTEWRFRFMHFTVLILFVIGFIAFLGPSWDQEKAPSKKINSKLVIALDLSQSMLATDISPNRLERAKFKINDFLEANPRAETSLLVFAGSTHTVIPFTTDYKLILDQVSGLQPKMMPIKGTGFSSLFSKMDTLFTENKAKGKIILITDDLSELPLALVSSFLQENNVELIVFPFATATGAIIPSFNQNSALDVQLLSRLDALENCAILEMTLDRSDVKDLAKVISDQLVFEDKSDSEEENWQDQGYWLVFPIAFIFLFSFRKGWALNLLIVSFTLGSCSEEHKQNSKDFTFDDLWYTKEYQAQKEYDTGNFLNAASEFKDPMRKGTAYFKAGDYLSARVAFEKDTTNQGLYNLGITYAKLGLLDKSQEVFEKVLELDPTNKNAANNLEQIIVAKEAIANLSPEDAALYEDEKRAKNKQNNSPEDLSGGGQEATKKQMEKERLEETTETETRKGKELEELPDDFKSGKGELPKNILMRKVDDDPALFLTRKFKYQVKKKQVVTETNLKKW